MSIPFNCPHCGVFTEVANEYAGETGPCAACRKPVTVPEKGELPKVTSNFRAKMTRLVLLTAVGIGLLGLLGVIFSLVFVMAFKPSYVPLIGGTIAPPAACESNLFRIGQAMDQYVKDHGNYPPAYVTDDNGKPMYSWRVLLLPYLGEDKLHSMFDLGKPWDDPVNKRAASRMPEVYGCPMDRNGLSNDETSYMLITGKTLLFFQEEKRKPTAIADPKGSTFLVVEVHNMGIHWAEPIDLDARQMDWAVNVDKGLGSDHHGGGMHALMADGSVHHLGDFVPPEELQAMATIHGGEKVDPKSWVSDDVGL